MSDGYSIFKSGGSWYVRWSEWRDGKRTQPSKRLVSVRDYPQKKEAKALAAEYMSQVRRAPTPQAGSSVGEFVTGTFFADAEKRLAKGTVRLYRQMWTHLEGDLGHMRLRDVRVVDVQNALNGIYRTRGDELCHAIFLTIKTTASAIFSHALRLGCHGGPNPATGTSVRGYGHTNHRANEAFTLPEIKQLLTMFPSGQVAVTIGLNAFLALRAPELQALLPDDFTGDSVRIHKDTKTGNDELLPVIAPLRRLLVDGWEPINLRTAEWAIRNRIKGTNLRWKGWYGFRRGMATNLFELGVRPEEAALILRNTPEVVRAHYIRLEKEGKKVDAMARLEQAYNTLEDNGKGAQIQTQPTPTVQ